MQKWKVLLTCLGLGLLLIFAACGNNVEEDEFVPLTWQSVLDTATARRAGIVKPNYYDLVALTQGRTPSSESPVRFWSEWAQASTSPPAMTSVADAIADTQELFEAIRDMYAGYVYFGGDEVFFAVLEDILSELEAINEEKMERLAFERILQRNLSQIIADTHFGIGDVHFVPIMSYFRNETLLFDKTPNGFQNRLSGLYLEHVEGHDIKTVMRVHANHRGELFYTPVFLLDEEGSPIRIEFMYEGSESVTYSFSRISYNFQHLELPTLSFIEGIPVVRVMTMGFDGNENGHNRRHAVAFMSFAEQLRDEPVIIVDIRNNSGGNGLLATRWVYALTGEIVPSNYVSVKALKYARHVFNPDNPFEIAPDVSDKFWSRRSFGDGYTLINYAPRRIIEREQLFILLTNRNTGSAGESFADQVFNMSNTLVIGTPTMGGMAFDVRYPNMTLLRTGTAFGFGRTMNVWPEGHFAEGAGIHPDIWTSANALTVALALLRNAGLTTE